MMKNMVKNPVAAAAGPLKLHDNKVVGEDAKAGAKKEQQSKLLKNPPAQSLDDVEVPNLGSSQQQKGQQRSVKKD